MRSFTVSAQHAGIEALKTAIAGPPNQMPMNVSDEADEAFMRELQKTDPERYAGLRSTLRLVEKVHEKRAERNQVRWDKAVIRRIKKTGVLAEGFKFCAHCKEPFRPERETVECCSRKCAYRVKQAAA